MTKIKSLFRKWGAIRIFLAVSLLSAGLFFEFLSCAAAVGLCVILLITVKKNGCFIFKVSLGGITAVIISLLYGVSSFWAVDSGMAFIGFFKFLPIALFALLVMQFKTDGIEYLDILPPTAAFMAIASGILSLIAPIREIFAPADRLSGFFQYSNTFALFLLVSMIVTATKEKLAVVDYFYLGIQILGILFSGSRTVFVLTVVTVILLVIFGKNKQLKISLLVFSAAGIAAGMIYAFLSDNFDTIGRFLTTSLGESTFVGRLLYFYDALPLILENPFGTGYLGFYYLQQSIQTGLYSVRYVHNDFLQLMLDIGWVPAVMLIVAAVCSFFRKGGSLRKRLMLFVMSSHCFFDFDLQFIAIFFIFILLLDIGNGKEYKFKGSLTAVKASTAAISCGALYMMTALAAAWGNAYTFSSVLFPYNTDVNIGLLTTKAAPEQMDKYADKIISQNKYVTVSYSAKAAYAYSEGDFTNVIKYKDLAIKNAPLVYEEYENYIVMLLTGYELYVQANDIQSADFCRAKVTELVNFLDSVDSKLSALGKMIDDQPQTQLPQELKQYINELFRID